MPKFNEIISKMILYDNDDEHNGSSADSEENLHYKHPVLQYNTICNVDIIIIDTIKIRRIIME